MNLNFFAARSVFILFLSLAAWTARAEKQIYTASFADFDQRARAGKPVSVVFFGGSLTGGSGASDPEHTSYRGLMEDYLKQKYPSASFHFYNSSLEGSGSKLGMFRVNSDVLAHNPDLVFLEFTTADKIHGVDRPTLASYERILRELISAGVPVEVILLGNKGNFGKDWKSLGPARLRDHLEMGTLYHTAIGNPFTRIQTYLLSEKRDRDRIWPEEEIYPNDIGHRFFFESARDGLEQAIREKRACNYPVDPVFADEYKVLFRYNPADFPLPPGWRAERSLRLSSDAVTPANDWMKKVAVADQDGDSVQPLRFSFTGTFLGIFGEGNGDSLGFTVSVDGDPIYFDEIEEEEVWTTGTARWGGGNRFFWHEISARLSPGRHIVEILPVIGQDAQKGDLRIESICVAGPALDSPESIAARTKGL